MPSRLHTPKPTLRSRVLTLPPSWIHLPSLPVSEVVSVGGPVGEKPECQSSSLCLQTPEHQIHGT